MKTSNAQSYIPALKYHVLTRYYDQVVSLTTREATFKSALVNQTAPLAGRHLLDIGCGTGKLTQMLAEREPSLMITGLVADPSALDIARTRLAPADYCVTLKQGFAQDMPFESATFDIAVSSLFFHHLNQRQKLQVLKETCRVLEPGGQLHIADWGKPLSLIQRGLFLLVQCLDGFETTQDSVEDLLPDLIEEAGFVHVTRGACIPTTLGTIRLLQARVG